MSKEKFTQGDWELSLIEADYSAAGSDAERLELQGLNPEFKAVSIGTSAGQVAIIPLDESNVGNAYLIKSSPKMYEEIQHDIEHLRIRARSAPQALKLRLVCEMDRKIRLLAEARGEKNDN